MKQKADKLRNTVVIYCPKGTVEPLHDSLRLIEDIWYKKTGEALTNSEMVMRALLFYKDYLENENKYEQLNLTGAKDNSKNFSRIR